MIRDAVLILIHEKVLQSCPDLSPRSRIDKLSSKDMGRLDNLAETIQESWAHILEVVIGLLILAHEIGWLWPMPLVIVAATMRVSSMGCVVAGS